MKHYPIYTKFLFTTEKGNFILNIPNLYCIKLTRELNEFLVPTSKNQYFLEPETYTKAISILLATLGPPKTIFLI